MVGAESEWVREATAALNSLALGSNQIGDDAMIQLLDVLKDVPLISLDISETGCGGPTGAKLVEIVSADTQLGVTIEELQLDGDTSAMEQLSQLCKRNKASPKGEQVDNEGKPP